MPDPLAGGGVEAHDALREEVVAEAVAAVVVVGRGAQRQVDVAQLGVGGQHAPGVGRARVGPRAVLPRLVAELAGLGDGVKLPQLLPGAHVEAAHVAGRVELVAGAVEDDRADDDDVADDDGNRHQLVVAPPDGPAQPLGGVDGPVGAEVGDGPPRPRVEGPQVGVAGRQEDARVAPVRPVGHPPRVVAGVGGSLALPAAGVEHPQGLARRGVDGRRLRQRRLDVEHAVGEHRRRLEGGGQGRQRRAVLGDDGVVGRLPAPHLAEPPDVAAVDLLERRVLRAAMVAPVGRPLSRGRAVLGGGRAPEQGCGHDGGGDAVHGVPPVSRRPDELVQDRGHAAERTSG